MGAWLLRWGLLATLAAGMAAGCSSSPDIAANAVAANDVGAPAAAGSGAAAATAEAQAEARARGELVPAVLGVPETASETTTHLISPGDVLEIAVFQVEDLSTKERVNESGSVMLPLIGAIQVAGLTTAEAEKEIEAALGRDYLQDPNVDVFVSDFANMKVTVGGRVKKPGVFPLSGQTTLIQAIAQAGGVSDTAKEDEVVLFRQQPGGKITAYVVDLEQVEAGQLRDPLLAANDKVLVPESGSKVFTQNVWDTLRGFVRFTPIPL